MTVPLSVPTACPLPLYITTDVFLSFTQDPVFYGQRQRYWTFRGILLHRLHQFPGNKTWPCRNSGPCHGGPFYFSVRR